MQTGCPLILPVPVSRRPRQQHPVHAEFLLVLHEWSLVKEPGRAAPDPVARGELAPTCF
jgi:hypothetical protein